VSVAVTDAPSATEQVLVPQGRKDQKSSARE